MGDGFFDRRLADLTVGDLFKGWAAYVVGGLLISAIVSLIAISLIDVEASGTGTGTEIPSKGTAISSAQYRSVRIGDVKGEVLQRLGEPAGTQAPQAEVSPGSYDDCAVYRHSSDPTSMYVICFDGGQVTEKSKF